MTDGLSREGFDIDLLEGKAREEAFAYVLVRARVEHKRDFKASDTGNFFLEFRQKGRDSGIKTTEADWWAIEFRENRWLVIDREELRQLGRRAWKAGKSRNGGDFNQYEGVLIPLAWFFESDDAEVASRLGEEVFSEEVA